MSVRIAFIFLSFLLASPSSAGLNHPDYVAGKLAYDQKAWFLAYQKLTAYKLKDGAFLSANPDTAKAIEKGIKHCIARLSKTTTIAPSSTTVSTSAGTNPPPPAAAVARRGLLGRFSEGVKSTFLNLIKPDLPPAELSNSLSSEAVQHINVPQPERETPETPKPE